MLNDREENMEENRLQEPTIVDVVQARIRSGVGTRRYELMFEGFADLVAAGEYEAADLVTVRLFRLISSEERHHKTHPWLQDLRRESEAFWQQARERRAV